MLATLSFQGQTSGYDHQTDMPATQTPEMLLRDDSSRFSFTDNDDVFPFHILECPDDESLDKETSAVWVKPVASAPEQVLQQQMLFSFISDATVLQSALKPHDLVFDQPGLKIATMNHTIWFNRPININQWLLLFSECPSTSSGRALSIGSAFNEGGELLCNIAQEGILR